LPLGVPTFLIDAISAEQNPTGKNPHVPGGVPLSRGTMVSTLWQLCGMGSYDGFSLGLILRSHAKHGVSKDGCAL